MTVYRVEHCKHRWGPFCTPSAYRIIADRAWYVTLRPSMHATDHGFDSTNSQRRYARLACTSAEQLAHWFPSTIRAELAALGFVVRVYEVEDFIAEDCNQVLVWLKHKRPVASRSLTEFFG